MTANEYQEKIYDALMPVWQEANKNGENLQFWEGLIDAKVNGLHWVKTCYEKQRKEQ